MEILAMGTNLLYMASAGIVIDMGLLTYKYSKKSHKNKTGSAFTGDKKEIKDYLGDDGIQLSEQYTLNEKNNV